MITKLTLAIDQGVIDRAKDYAQKRGSSLSKLVEFYFTSITSKKKEKTLSLAPMTSKLSGMVKTKSHAKDKDILTKALTEKYL